MDKQTNPVHQKPGKNKEEQTPKKCDCEELKKQTLEFKDKYLRALADYQNFEKRINDEKNMIRQWSNKSLILKLLPFIDGLDSAQIFIKDNGLNAVRNAFLKVLSEEGVTVIDILNKPYDPVNAEVIEMVPGKDDGIVVEILRKGYMYKGKLLRVAQVKVSKKTN